MTFKEKGNCDEVFSLDVQSVKSEAAYSIDKA